MNEQQANAFFDAFTHHDDATAADKRAIADPTAHGSEEIKLARFLAHWLDYDYASYHHRLKKKARELLEHSKGDYVGMWEVIEAKAKDASFKAWVTENDVNVYAVTNILKDIYSRRLVQERKSQHANTTAGRAAKYASYPGVLS